MLNSQNVSKKEKILSKIIFSFGCSMKNINKKDRIQLILVTNLYIFKLVNIYIDGLK